MDIKMKRILGLIMMCILLAVMPAGCSASKGDAETDTGGAGTTQSAESEESAAVEAPEGAETSDTEDTENNTGEEIIEMKMTINGTAVKVDWENNASVKALAKMAGNGPVTIETEPYGGFEQVGSIGATLPSNDTDIRTKAGDIMLYTSSQMVIFYGSNSWAYTRLGRIADKSASELSALLGSGDVTITLTLE